MTARIRQPHPVWSSPASLDEGRQPLEGASSADVAVIGAGFLGLVAALQLAMGGKSVIVLEAAGPDCNASAASAGQVGPMFLGGGRGPEHLFRKLGQEQGERLARLVAGAGRWLFDLIDEHEIECEARSGYLCVYRSEKSLARAAARFDQWRLFGGEAQQVGRYALLPQVASSRFVGGFFLPEGGMLNPARLLAGLAAAIGGRGGEVYFHSPVTSVGRQGKAWEVHTPGGVVSAGAVIVATGISSSSPLPALATSVYAAPCGIAATRALDDHGASLLPERGPVADLDDKAVFAPAIGVDGRLIVSFLLEEEPPTLPASAAPARKRLARIFPHQAQPDFETLSWGRIAITPDGIPRLFRDDSGIIAVGGCNGFGLTLGLIAAREAARLILGVPAEDLALPVSSPKPLPGARVAPKLFRTVAAPLLNRLGV